MAELRNQIIQTLIATRGQSEGVTADALIELMGKGEAVAERAPTAPGGINWLCDVLPERGAKLYLHPAPAVDDGVVRDAERYRWLRSNNVGPSQIEKVSDDYSPPYFTLKCENELDTAIDAAMKEQQDANRTL